MALNGKMTPLHRAVALFEACKGLLVFFAAVPLFSFVHHTLRIVSEQVAVQEVDASMTY